MATRLRKPPPAPPLPKKGLKKIEEHLQATFHHLSWANTRTIIWLYGANKVLKIPTSLCTWHQNHCIWWRLPPTKGHSSSCLKVFTVEATTCWHVSQQELEWMQTCNIQFDSWASTLSPCIKKDKTILCQWSQMNFYGGLEKSHSCFALNAFVQNLEILRAWREFKFSRHVNWFQVYWIWQMWDVMLRKFIHRCQNQGFYSLQLSHVYPTHTCLHWISMATL